MGVVFLFRNVPILLVFSFSSRFLVVGAQCAPHRPYRLMLIYRVRGMGVIGYKFLTSASSLLLVFLFPSRYRG